MIELKLKDKIQMKKNLGIKRFILFILLIGVLIVMIKSVIAASGTANAGDLFVDKNQITNEANSKEGEINKPLTEYAPWIDANAKVPYGPDIKIDDTGISYKNARFEGSLDNGDSLRTDGNHLRYTSADGKIMSFDSGIINPSNRPISLEVPANGDWSADILAQLGGGKYSGDDGGSDSGGDGGGGSGRGSLTPKADAFLTAFLGAWSSIASILAQIKPQQGSGGGSGGVGAYVKDSGATSFEKQGNELSIAYENRGGAGLKDEKNKEKLASVEQEDKTKKGLTTIKNSNSDGLTTMVATNTNAGIYEANGNEIGRVATIHTPEIKTEIVNNAKTGEPNPSAETRTRSITASVISDLKLVSGNAGQHVWLIEHDIDIEGEKISVELFKPFNEISAKGSVLSIVNTKANFEFNGQRMYYNRVPPENKYFINKVYNGLDSKNSFSLLQGGERGNYLIDSSKKITIGDKVTEHPKMKGIYIAKEREKMFEKAVGMR